MQSWFHLDFISHSVRDRFLRFSRQKAGAAARLHAHMESNAAKRNAEPRRLNWTGLPPVSTGRPASIHLPSVHELAPLDLQLTRVKVALTKHAGGGFRVRRESCKNVSQDDPNGDQVDIFLSHIIEVFV